MSQRLSLRNREVEALEAALASSNAPDLVAIREKLTRRTPTQIPGQVSLQDYLEDYPEAFSDAV